MNITEIKKAAQDAAWVEDMVYAAQEISDMLSNLNYALDDVEAGRYDAETEQEIQDLFSDMMAAIEELDANYGVSIISRD